MTRKIITGLMGVLIVVLAFSTCRSRKDLAGVQAELEQLKTGPAGTSQENKAPAVKLHEAQNEPVEEVPTTATLAEAAGEKLPAAGTGGSKGNSTRRMMRSLSKMMDNPAMNKMMAASQRGALDVMYADLAAHLQLSGEEKEYFMDLLLARQMNLVDISMKMMAGNLTSEERDALAADVEEKNRLIGEEMEYFLNSEDDAAEWKFYEKTLQDRMMLSQMEQSLGESDAALSEQTYRQLLEAMSEEKSGFEFTSDFADEKNMDMSAERFSPENIRNYANDLKALNEKVIDRARAILTPEQLEALIKSLTDHLEMQMAQLEMAAQMFGGKQ